MRAIISVYVRSRGPSYCPGEREGNHGRTHSCNNLLPCKTHPEEGDGVQTTGREVVVTANGHLLPCKSIKLEVKDRKATAILEVDVDEVAIQDVIGKITDSGQLVPEGS